jgi:hypothetical protein
VGLEVQGVDRLEQALEQALRLLAPVRRLSADLHNLPTGCSGSAAAGAASRSARLMESFST